MLMKHFMKHSLRKKASRAQDTKQENGRLSSRKISTLGESRKKISYVHFPTVGGQLSIVFGARFVIFGRRSMTSLIRIFGNFANDMKASRVDQSSKFMNEKPKIFPLVLEFSSPAQSQHTQRWNIFLCLFLLHNNENNENSQKGKFREMLFNVNLNVKDIPEVVSG